MNTTTVIPKAKLASYERWKLDTFDIPIAEASAENPQSCVSAQNPAPSAVTQETESVIQAAKEDGLKQGYEEGYKNGFQEGRSHGHQEGRQQGESEVKAELNQINSVFNNLNEQIQSIEQQIAQDILALAISLTKKMITQALTIHPELILPIVKEAARHLPGSEQRLRLFLNPEDAKIIRQYLSEKSPQESWTIHEDTHQERGGCRLEADGSEIDASLETRWRRALAAIGENNDWIDQ
ncbi:flagellar assembly protein FliH [Nitrosomonas sp. Nm51]|uniref:flagellar assembly protein FliH n=1 Tax=Nitrosomonas sp. Nm51 TaxID=133720 RepID=UPI0008D69386|nr:flagellar assembly protein FliH [Nitrosomonas sp. Nm51]SER12723.1 flagellar assembly protein FliH [Nitrosomonas sp. Nm51]